MQKDFKVSFFQINMLNNKESFDDFLKRIALLNAEDCTDLRKSVRVDQLNFDDCRNIWTGAITKIRMDSLPERINQKTGVSSSLPISDDEGIAETTAFLYDSKIDILLMQRSVYGPTENNLVEYIQNKCNSQPFNISVILKKNIYEKLQQSAYLYKLECKTAKLSPDIFSNNQSAGAFLRTLGTTDYISVDIVLRASKKQGLASWIKDFVLVLSNNITGPYKKLKVGSVSADGVCDILDLLSAKKEETISLIRESFRTISFETRKEILISAYASNKEELYELFGKN